MANSIPVHTPKLEQLFAEATTKQASDIHLATDDHPWLRVAGELQPSASVSPFDQEEIEAVIAQIVHRPGRDRLHERGSVDGAVTDQNGQRYRFNVYRSGGTCSLALRRLEDRFQELTQLGLPDALYGICDLKDGLVLVAGPTGSGKSTTLATLLNRINETRSAHIITIEDPVEYLHKNKRSRVTQRQVGSDTDSFASALVDAVRQDPDVILVGELRDLDTIRTAVTAAETGHLVFATVHAGDCVSAIERTVGVFPGNEQSAIRNLLAGSLRTVVTQHLMVADGERADIGGSGNENLPRKSRVLASEVLHVNQAASNQIATDNLPQLQSILEMHRSDGMYTLDSSLARLWRRGKISERNARSIARNPNMLRDLARAI